MPDAIMATAMASTRVAKPARPTEIFGAFATETEAPSA